MVTSTFTTGSPGTLSAGGLVYTCGAGDDGSGGCSTDGIGSGKQYAEFTLHHTKLATLADSDGLQVMVLFGLGTSTSVPGAVFVQFIYDYNSDHTQINFDAGSGAFTTINLLTGQYPSGTTVCVAYDGATGNAWMRMNNGLWNGSTADPVAGTGGFNVIAESYTVDPNLVLYFQMAPTAGDSVTAKFGASGYTYTPPTGYSTWTVYVPPTIVSVIGSASGHATVAGSAFGGQGRTGTANGQATVAGSAATNQGRIGTASGRGSAAAITNTLVSVFGSASGRGGAVGSPAGTPGPTGVRLTLVPNPPVGPLGTLDASGLILTSVNFESAFASSPPITIGGGSKSYAEFTVTNVYSTNPMIAFATSVPAGSAQQSFYTFPPVPNVRKTWPTDTDYDLGSGTLNAGDLFCVAYNEATKTVWFRVNSGLWNGTSADPAAGTGGLDVNPGAGGVSITTPMSIWLTVVHGSWIANFGSTYRYVPPTGFSGWDGQTNPATALSYVSASVQMLG